MEIDLPVTKIVFTNQTVRVKNKTNKLTCKANVSLVVDNQKLRQLLVNQLERQKQLEVQVEKQHHILRRQKGRRSSIPKGQGKTKLGIIVKYRKEDKVNPREEKEGLNKSDTEPSKKNTISNKTRQGISRKIGESEE